MLVSVMAVLWPFLRVIFWTELAVPCAWLPKDKLVGETVTDWAEAGAQEADTPTASKRRQTLNPAFTDNLARKDY